MKTKHNIKLLTVKQKITAELEVFKARTHIQFVFDYSRVGDVGFYSVLRLHL